MQVEGIRTGDRYDVKDDRGRTVGGWTATGEAIVKDGRAYVPIRHHDGREDTIVKLVGTQIPITFGVGNPAETMAKVTGSTKYTYVETHVALDGTETELSRTEYER